MVDQTPLQVGQELQRRAIGPVGVVEHQQERSPRTEGGDELEQAVNHPVGVAGLRRSVGRALEQPARGGGGTGEDRLALNGVQLGQRAGEQPDHPGPRQPLLELTAAEAARAQGGMALGEAAGGRKQCRLPDPGPTLDDDRFSRAPRDGRREILKLRELTSRSSSRPNSNPSTSSSPKTGPTHH